MARQMAHHVDHPIIGTDGAVIGSALINLMQDNPHEDAPQTAARFLQSLNE